MKNAVRSLACVCACLCSAVASATTYYLVGKDSGGSSSMSGDGSPAGWSTTPDGTTKDQTAATAGNDYVVNKSGSGIRSPQTTGYTFLGDSLVFSAGELLFVDNGNDSLTIPNLIVATDGTMLYRNGGQCRQTLQGALTVNEGGRFKHLVDSKSSHTGDPKTSVFAMAVSGTGTVVFGADSDASKTNTIFLTGNFADFAGRFEFVNHWSSVVLAAAQAVPSALAELDPQAIRLDDASFVCDVTATLPATRGVVIATDSTIAVKAGETLTIDGPVSGSGIIIKKGAGRLVLTNASPDYQGSVTCFEGTVERSAAAKHIPVSEAVVLTAYLRADTWTKVKSGITISQIAGIAAEISGGMMGSATAAYATYPSVRAAAGENGAIETEYVIQFSGVDGDWRKIVAIAFRERNGDLYAKRLWREVLTPNESRDLLFVPGMNIGGISLQPGNVTTNESAYNTELKKFPMYRDTQAQGSEVDGSNYGIKKLTIAKGRPRQAYFNASPFYHQCEPFAYNVDHLFTDRMTLDELKAIVDAGQLHGYLFGQLFAQTEYFRCVAIYPHEITTSGRRELVVQFQINDLGTPEHPSAYVKGVVVKFFAAADNPKVLYCRRLWRCYHNYAATPSGTTGPAGTFDFYTNPKNKAENTGYDMFRIWADDVFKFPASGFQLIVR